MESILNSIIDLTAHIDEIPSYLIYLFFFLSTMVENIFPPWPSDTLMLFSGFIASRGSVSLSGVFFSSLLGNIAGGMVMYYFGGRIFLDLRKFQKKIHASQGFLKKFFSFASHDSLVKSRNMFDSYGIKFVLFSRFFPGVRFFVSIIAGLHEMKPVLYLISFSTGSFLWGLILTGTGFFMGVHWETALKWIKIYNLSVTAGIVLVIFIYILIKKRKNIFKRTHQ